MLGLSGLISKPKMRMVVMCAIGATLIPGAVFAAEPPQLTKSLINVFRPLKGKYPALCEDVLMGSTGLCLLGSRVPRVTDQFLIIQADAKWAPLEKAQSVSLNRFMPLNPGNYLIYSDSGIDKGHETRVTLARGKVTQIQTSTVKFAISGKRVNRLQHYQSQNGIGGRGCSAVIVGKSGTMALLPGNYQVNVLPKKDADSSPHCSNTGVTFNLLAGEVKTNVMRTVKDQTLPKLNSYVHPNGKSALATMSNFMADVEQLALLPNWRSWRGIHNPSAQNSPALILSGIGAQQFVVPFTMKKGQSQCGISLPDAGLTAHVLLSDCQFKGNKLTAFRVQPGSYYTLNNRHGKTAIEGNFINNPIVVKNVTFTLN